MTVDAWRVMRFALCSSCLFFICLFVHCLSLITVYNAVGLASFDLFDEIDYDSWFSNHLLKELQIKDMRSVILIREKGLSET